MIKRPFIGFATPRIEYHPLPGHLTPTASLETPDSVTLLIACKPDDVDSDRVKIGDRVKTGQKLTPTFDPNIYGIATISGTISAIERLPGEAGQEYMAVTTAASKTESSDDTFESICQSPTLENAMGFLKCLPGAPSFEPFLDEDNPIHTIIISCADPDLLVVSAMYTLSARMGDIQTGIKYLKTITGVEKVILASPRDAVQGHGEIGATVVALDPAYPSGFPKLIAQKVLGEEIPNGTSFQDLGICFFTGEAVAAIGRAFTQKKLPLSKTITFIDKQGNRSLISAKIGTPIADILKVHHVALEKKDRIILGGPMTGHSVFSAQYPVQPTTDAILLQDSQEISLVADTPCINCGDCVRSCPARIQVNLLVRFLEAGLYQEAEDHYDLSACLECGICSYVCVSRIPIFQYIKLAKYELGRMTTEETTDE